MSYKLVNIFFFFALIFIFVLFCKVGDHIRVSVALLLSIVFCSGAFLMGWFTLDGLRSGILFGTIAYGLGGLTGAVIILFFFVFSSILTRKLLILVDEDFTEKKSRRRNGVQVWANGFWFATFVMLWFIFDEYWLFIAAIGSIASANADTWATEIGGNFRPGKTYLITDLSHVKPGRDGGVSVKGIIAAIAASVLVAFIYMIMQEPGNWKILIAIATAGFLGSLADSYLGASLQGSPVQILGRKVLITNDEVNWLSTGIGAFLAVILTLFI